MLACRSVWIRLAWRRWSTREPSGTRLAECAPACTAHCPAGAHTRLVSAPEHRTSPGLKGRAYRRPMKAMFPRVGVRTRGELGQVLAAPFVTGQLRDGDLPCSPPRSPRRTRAYGVQVQCVQVAPGGPQLAARTRLAQPVACYESLCSSSAESARTDNTYAASPVCDGTVFTSSPRASPCGICSWQTNQRPEGS